ncbi:MAG TPA: alpha-ketoglutarate-dependent dioxygenase AlkB [Chitinophagaceae bacterium]|nr:alpha-ketoglutarate-dependent dioxygenase AlkB [Chitinophagaceae bacterium]
MSLFAPENILPFDGAVFYLGPIFPFDEALSLFQQLFREIPWQADEAFIYGKHFITKRKVAWYANQSFPYTYSNTTKMARPWTPLLLQLKSKVEVYSGENFNACLLNLYHSGDEGMAWHSDDEPSLSASASIASLSLGAARKFAFKHKQSQQRIDILLEPGSLLLMKPPTQTFWQHRLPPSKKIHSPRINLTFRTMNE